MLVGWGGNNGSTLTASLIANRDGLTWKTRTGSQSANYYGSMLLASTTRIGIDENGEDVFVPLKSLVPLIDPNEFVLGGWDISGMSLAQSMDRAQVLEPDLKRQVYEEMSRMKPLPSVYYKDYIATNQEARADNLIGGDEKWGHLERIRQDIREFKEGKGLDRVIVLWTANTERFSDIIEGIFSDFCENLRLMLMSWNIERTYRIVGLLRNWQISFSFEKIKKTKLSIDSLFFQCIYFQ